MRTVRVDVHNYDVRLKHSLDGVWRALPSEDAELVQAFVDWCLADRISVGRCARYAQNLKRLRSLLGVGFGEASRRDVERALAALNRSGLRPWTLQFYRVTLKKFFRWLRFRSQPGWPHEFRKRYPQEVAWIKTSLKESEEILPEEILTEEEIKRMVGAAENLRDKVFLDAFYESGFRPGEFLRLRIRNVEFDEYGATLSTRGKTGARRVRVIESAPRLQMWVENHPEKDNPDAWLWINIGSTNRGARFQYFSLRKMIRAVATRAGIVKRVNPYSFRHARATHLAKVLTEAQMCNFFGWKIGSKAPSVYVHLSGRDLDPPLLAHYGLKKKEELESGIKPRRCPRCETLNSHDAKYCRRCSIILDPEEALRVENKRQNLEKKVEDLLKRLEALSARPTSMETETYLLPFPLSSPLSPFILDTSHMNTICIMDYVLLISSNAP